MLDLNKCVQINQDDTTELLCAMRITFHGERSQNECVNLIQDNLYDDIGMAGNFRLMLAHPKCLSSYSDMALSMNSDFIYKSGDNQTCVDVLFTQDVYENDSTIESEFVAICSEFLTFRDMDEKLVKNLEQLAINQ